VRYLTVDDTGYTAVGCKAIEMLRFEMMFNQSVDRFYMMVKHGKW
jgi:hypothetical protein